MLPLSDNFDPTTQSTKPQREPSPAGRAAVFWATGFLIAALLALAIWAVDVLLLVFAGVLVATLLLSLCRPLERFFHLRHSVSLVIVVLVLSAATAAFGLFLFPQISDQIEELKEELPKALGALQTRVQKYSWGRWFTSQSFDLQKLSSLRGDIFSRLTGVVSGALAAFGTVLVVGFAGLFFAAQPSVYVDGLTTLAVPSRRQRLREVFAAVAVELQNWLMGQLIAIAFIGMLTWLGLWFLGIKLALSLAVLAAILAFIPNFGPIIAAVPAILLAMLEGPSTAMWVAGLYVGIQTVESYLLTPLVQQQTVHLPPALTMFAQLTMGALVGGVGLALATPLTVVILVFVRKLYVEDMLEASPVLTSVEKAS